MKRIKITLTSLVLIFCAKLFSQTSIQMEKVGGVFAVPCKVNGLTLNFIFDTGAGDVSISLTEALYMLKNGHLNTEDILGKGTYQTADGSISEGTLINIRLIEFSDYKLYNVKASVIHSLKAPLLLGQTALAQLGKFQFDPKSGILTILKDSEKNTEMYTELARIASYNKDYPNAIKYLEIKKKGDFNNLTNNEVFNLGKAYYFLGVAKDKEVRSRKDDLKKSKSSMSSDISVIEKDALHLFLSAESSFKQLTLSNPDWPWAYTWLGRTNALLDPNATKVITKQQYEKVLSLLTPVEKTGTYKSNAIEAYEYLAYYYFVQNDAEKVKAYFLTLIELDPSNEKAKSYLNQQ